MDLSGGRLPRLYDEESGLADGASHPGLHFRTHVGTGVASVAIHGWAYRFSEATDIRDVSSFGDHHCDSDVEVFKACTGINGKRGLK